MKLYQYGIVLTLLAVLIFAAATIQGLRMDLERVRISHAIAGDGWYETLGALKLSLERTDTLRLELAHEQRRIPICVEDAVILGMGDFDAGQWDAYTCGPSVDDYITLP